MSIDNLPRSYDAWRTWTPDQDEVGHDPRCPQHEDQARAFECGGVEEHFCSLIEREINGCAIVEAACKCADLADDDEADKADAAEARADSMRMGD